MKNNNKTVYLLVLIVVIIGVILIVQNPFSSKKGIVTGLQNSENIGLDIGQQAPDFILKSVDGNNIQLSGFRGKKSVVVNFWATWCPPCREEMPAFEEIFIRNKDKLEIFGVNLQESERAINNFLLEIPVTYTLLLDPDKEVKELYNVFTQPVTYFVDKEGILVDKKFGLLTPQEIEDKFGKLGIN